MTVALTDSIPARIGAAAWFVVPIAWSGSVVLARTRAWEGLPQFFFMVGILALVVAGVTQLVMVLRASRPVRAASTRAGIAFLGLGIAASVAVGWAVLVWLALYAVGMLLVGTGSGSRVVSLIGAGFATGAAAFVLLTILKVGRPDSYGDYPIAWVGSLVIGTITAGLGMLVWSRGTADVADASVEAKAAA